MNGSGFCFGSSPLHPLPLSRGTPPLPCLTGLRPAHRAAPVNWAGNSPSLNYTPRYPGNRSPGGPDLGLGHFLTPIPPLDPPPAPAKRGNGPGWDGRNPGTSFGGPLDTLPARGQPPDGAYRPRPEINPEQGRWLQKNRRGVCRREGGKSAGPTVPVEVPQVETTQKHLLQNGQLLSAVVELRRHQVGQALRLRRLPPAFLPGLLGPPLSFQN